MVRIGEDRNERLDIVPAQPRVLVTVRPKCACRACWQPPRQCRRSRSATGASSSAGTAPDGPRAAGGHVSGELAEGHQVSGMLFDGALFWDRDTPPRRGRGCAECALETPAGHGPQDGEAAGAPARGMAARRGRDPACRGSVRSTTARSPQGARPSPCGRCVDNGAHAVRRPTPRPRGPASGRGGSIPGMLDRRPRSALPRRFAVAYAGSRSRDRRIKTGRKPPAHSRRGPTSPAAAGPCWRESFPGGNPMKDDNRFACLG